MDSGRGFGIPDFSQPERRRHPEMAVPREYTTEPLAAFQFRRSFAAGRTRTAVVNR